MLATIGCQRARRLANRPFDWVQAICAIGEMCCADVFAGGDEVAGFNGDERAQWNLKWVRRREGSGLGSLGVCANAVMNVYGIPTDANAVVKSFGMAALFGRDVLLQDALERQNAAAFAM